jgi:hypothetical protein
VGGWIDLVSNGAGTTLILSVPLRPGAGAGSAGARAGGADEDSSDWGSP